MERPHGNCYWVSERFLAGECPGAKDAALARQRLRRHLQVGVTVFLDLTEPGELVRYDELLRQEATQLGRAASYHRLPIPDVSVPKTRAQMGAILDRVDDSLAAGQTVYLHCWGGVGRTGTVVGCYLVRHGLSGEAALARLASWWQQVDKVWRQPHSPETAEQRAYVRSWVE
ncbi:MAG: hypothetical protein R3300_02000 [Candidatus Promineifilaceae bacterium]|nr:hypothetical protein [Candidatus Promineifilaceae bacterium]